MRAFIQDGKLIVVTQEYQKLASGGEIPEEETIFDETWTDVMRNAFYRESVESQVVIDKIIFNEYEDEQ